MTGSVGARADETARDWCKEPPTLASTLVTLRELTAEDAPSLTALLNAPAVGRYITPAPDSEAGFRRFIAWSRRQREQKRALALGVVPHGCARAVGVMQLRPRDFPSFRVSEWGFVLGAPFWGTGIFVEAAGLWLDFAFDRAGVHRVEVRAALANGRGHGALRRLGAVEEGILRRAFVRDREYHDQVLWSVLADDWRLQRVGRRPQVH